MPEQQFQPPPHPVQTWKILSVREGKTVPNPKGAGTLTRYYVDFEGMEDGWSNSDGAFWQRKEGNAPNRDEEVFGEITVGDYGYKFQLRQKDATHVPASTDTPSPSTFESAAGRPQAGTSEAPDARQRSIVRQHSEGMALQFLAIAAGEKDNQQRPAVEFTTTWLEANLMPIINFFVADANGETMPTDPDEKLPF